MLMQPSILARRLEPVSVRSIDTQRMRTRLNGPPYSAIRGKSMNTTTSRALKWLGTGLLAFVLSGCLPIPIFSITPDEPEAGESVTFDASETIVSNVPADTVAVSYSWNFGDGNNGRGSSTTHTYENAGTYNIVLSVTDSAGRVGTLEENITVKAATVTTDTATTTTTVE
ncbi:PKD domain-containing protein [Hydrogenophaga sp. PAMC20947]|uniref:PKD domain-containing protein n=1 Tax=Hydrogenophaga sp. PAMC20947 TaxID=2565558 RepID=UPI00109D8654|nr:PKD domain-containing protein [Hydrogenophaga sp. PAMC20947]QCB46966.1 PKD domain-containing protein [Hydrogenophaga sp. PAMC20947]